MLPLVAVAFAIAATASVALAGSGKASGVGLLLEYAGWVALVTTLGFLLALGVSSLLDSRATSIGVLLGAGSASISLLTAIVLVVAWTVVPLAAGAWRTQTRDA